MRWIIFFVAFVLCCSCKSSIKNTNDTEQLTVQDSARLKRPLAIQNGKIFNADKRKMLYGGKDSTQHFDITDCVLKDEQFHYGIGRERFPALLEPSFISIEEADSSWVDSTRFLIIQGATETKAYSVEDLTRHEVVNDQIDGEPIMAAYCILADLGGIYNRSYGDEVLTFALSGYTYFDEEVWGGLDGFILWDRDTESLWWPLTGKAVSGPLKGVYLLERDKSDWKDTDWKDIKENHPNAKIMISGLDYERPKTWRKLKNTDAIVRNYSSAKQ